MMVGALRRWPASFVCLFLIGVSRPSLAEPTRILFVSHEPTPFSARIRAEIEAMGLSIVPVDALDGDDTRGAAAAAQVIESPPPRRVELWLRDENTGRLALDRILEAEQVETEPGAADATSAVRASEQLRAFFQPVRESSAALELMPPRPPPSPLKPSAAPRAAPRAPVPPPIRTEEGRFFQELAAAVPLQPGSLGLDLLLRARMRFGATYGLGVKLALPIVPSTLSSAGNVAEVSTSLFGAELSALFVTTPFARLSGYAGVSVFSLSASGQATAPYTDRVDRKWAALPSFGSELGFRVTKNLRLCLGAELGVAWPKLELVFAGQRVATFGRPFALLSAGLGVAWGNP